MSSRSEVYAAFDSERDYQDSLPPERSNGSPKTVGDYLTMLAYYLAEAQAAWTKNNSDLPALEQIRKIGGVATHCMEDHGAIRRPGY